MPDEPKYILSPFQDFLSEQEMLDDKKVEEILEKLGGKAGIFIILDSAIPCDHNTCDKKIHTIKVHVKNVDAKAVQGILATLSLVPPKSNGKQGKEM